MYSSIDEAQEHVPFDLLTLDPVPEGFSLAGITVHSRPVLDLGRNVTMVEMTYRASDARFLSLIQRDAPFSLPESAWQNGEFEGVPVYVDTQYNAEDTQIGMVYTTIGDLTIVVTQTHVDVQEVLNLLERVK